MGDGGYRCIDETWPNPPVTPYGRAKRAAEQWVLETGRTHGTHVVNLRLATVYGQGSRGNLERMIDAIRRGFFPPLPDVGNKRSLVDVRNVVEAALLAASDPVANQQTYIVTDGKSYSSREIYELIFRALGKPAPSWAVPMPVLRLLAGIMTTAGNLVGRKIGFDYETLDKLLGWACYSSDKIRRELGYRSAFCLEEALPDILRQSQLKG